MTSDRIKEIQSKTAYPDSISVQQALLQVWNECERPNEHKQEGGYSEKDMLEFMQFIISNEELENTSGVSLDTAKYYLNKFNKQPIN
jgi:Fic family protein